MPKRRYSAEQIVTLLRQIEVAMGQGKSAQIVCREAGISEQSFYRWRKEYGWLQVEQAKRMAKTLQRRQTTFIAGLSAPSTADPQPIPPAPRSGRYPAIVYLCRRDKKSIRSGLGLRDLTACFCTSARQRASRSPAISVPI